jgi:hypothetical protein
MRLAPLIDTPGPTVVSAPISTPTSMLAVSGEMNVTPARACASISRRCAKRSTRMRSTRLLTPRALATSSVG